jgi:hypothetical protein
MARFGRISRKENGQMMKVMEPQQQMQMEVCIDYPKEGEKICHPSYTLRIGCPDMQNVQKCVVSIDDNPWQACRCESGYWWFDWSNYMSGRHEIEVKCLTKDGRTMTSEVRRCKVELDKSCC